MPEIWMPPPRRVQRLSRELSDQIAAGEVIERPASVVKELVENALDAGSRTIRVEIESGGLDRIVVTDDGYGMDGDSALLAIERHATSKLYSFDELFRLATFGFRGEALSSIASVSRFKLTTRVEESLAGTEITLLSGAKPHVREVGAPVGTSVEVVELFHNVPARRKFIKSVSTEAGHVADTLLDLALARPDVAFTLVRDGRVARQYLRADGRGARGRDAMARSLQEGARLAEEFVHIAVDRQSTSIEALLSPPERARSGANGLHLLVNGRAVRDRALARAVAMSYGSVLDPGRYPLGVLWVEVPPEEVDVNVHPQKAEVRFARGRDLYNDVTRGLAGALAETFRRLGRVLVEDDPTPVSLPRPTTIARGLHELSQVMGKAITESRKPATEPASSVTPPSRDADPWGLAADPSPAMTRAQMEMAAAPPPPPQEYTLPSAQYMVFPAKARPQPPAAPAATTGSSTPSDADDEAAKETTLVSPSVTTPPVIASEPTTDRQAKGAYGALKFLAQVRATYLVCEGADGIYVIDQHAAAERVNFAKLRAAFAKKQVVRQQLLVADVLEVSSAEAVLADEMRETFLSFGVDAHAIGDGRVAVLGIPALMKKARPSVLFRDLLDELARTGERRFSDAADLVLATMACHGSVRAGDPMHPDECVALLRSLDEVDFAGYCPHGRPIVTSLSYIELEKKVGRR
jgi:DNA mismatch repair protein MutL